MVCFHSSLWDNKFTLKKCPILERLTWPCHQSIVGNGGQRKDVTRWETFVVLRLIVIYWKVVGWFDLAWSGTKRLLGFCSSFQRFHVFCRLKIKKFCFKKMIWKIIKPPKLTWQPGKFWWGKKKSKVLII